jgi:hypothetical protein
MVRSRKVGFNPAFLLDDAFLGPVPAVILPFQSKTTDPPREVALDKE